MQTTGTIASRKPGTLYRKPNQTRYSQRSKQKKTDYGAKRRCNSFLKTVFAPIAPKIVTRDWGYQTYNYVTEANYSYLLQSAMRYASLSGMALNHHPGNSIGEGISNIYDELDEMIGEINLNIEPYEGRLEFVLWKYHPWGNYTFYWLPVKFTENLNPRLKKIAGSFIHQFIHSNGLETTNKALDIEWVLEWAKESMDQEECEPEDRKKNMTLINAYESGKIHRLMDRIDAKCYYKDLPKALDKYIPNNEFEKQLIEIFREGLQFIGKDKPAIMSYGYDPLYDEERDCQPVGMERIIRIVYDLDDFVTEWIMDWTNSELRESYDISPATRFFISPETDKLFSMDDYPDIFFKWFNKICTLIS